MDRKEHYRDLMEKIHRTHQEFSTVWNSVREEELRRRRLDCEGDDFYERMEEVWEVNGIAYDAAQHLSQQRDQFVGTLFEEVPFEEFLENKPEAIDAVIDFMEIDIPAFRCGYAKEWCYSKLKTLTLNESQIQRLRRLTLHLCQLTGYRRELTYLARFVARHADEELIHELIAIDEKGDNPYNRQKAGRVLSIIFRE